MKYVVRAIVCTLCLTLFVAAPASGQLKSGDSGKLAYFHLTGSLTESPGAPNPLDMLMNMDRPKTFKEVLDRFKKARDDDSVKAVLLTFESPSIGFAQLQELRQAMSQVRAADKDIYVHAEQLFTGLYTLATAASHISLVPTGDLWLTGFYGEQPYLKGLLDHMRVETDFEHFEEYKSAGEIFYRESPSPEAEANLNWLLDGLYEAMVSMIAADRQLSPEKVKALIDNGPYTAKQALKGGLIDSVKHRQDFIQELKERYDDAKIVKNYGKDEGPDIPDDFFGMFKFIMDTIKGAGKESTAPAVGIVYVEGAIMVGSGKQASPFSAGGAFSAPVRKALGKAAKDDSVKAVVLRVDSPGGSALASEIILDASKRVAAKKPLIVSMGNVAGSGGYYVACGSDAIFADETTITASIGVVGGKLITTGGWNALGINWYEIQRGQNAAIMSSARHWNDRERAKIKGYMEEVYETFKGHVTACRGDKLTKPIGEIAGGRVFTGKQALELGLVDKLGGLNDAIKFAAAQANISDYEVRIIPRPKDPIEMLLEMFGGGDDDDEEVVMPATPRLFTWDSPVMQGILPVLQRLDPHRVEAIMRALHRLELIHSEGVITMMPQEIIIR